MSVNDLTRGDIKRALRASKTTDTIRRRLRRGPPNADRLRSIREMLRAEVYWSLAPLLDDKRTRVGISDRVRRAVRRRHQGICWICRRPVDGDGQMDHLIPRSFGGKNDASNIALACGPCNAGKRDQIRHSAVRWYLFGLGADIKPPTG